MSAYAVRARLRGVAVPPAGIEIYHWMEMASLPHGFGERVVPVRPLDEQQMRLVAVLDAAAGQPVSFAELHRRGIENPATLAYELQIAGLPITHVQHRSPGGPLRSGVKLEVSWREAAESSTPPAGPGPARAAAASLPSGAAAAGRLVERSRERARGALVRQANRARRSGQSSWERWWAAAADVLRRLRSTGRASILRSAVRVRVRLAARPRLRWALGAAVALLAFTASRSDWR